MLFNIGDLVTRKSYNNDMVFKIMKIDGSTVLLKGINVRLVADADVSDLEICKGCVSEYFDSDDDLLERMNDIKKLDRDEYFYLPGKVLHIDGDKDYLDRCLKFYKEMNVLSYGLVISEKNIAGELKEHLNKIKPDVLVITGHDAFNEGSDNYLDEKNYKNSRYFIDAIKVARNYEKNQNKLVIIAGACQSNYEELIKSGANFASSPKRINIHALDPAIVASSVALSDQSKTIDLISILEKTKYGKDGMGGIITNGVMFVGYPR